MPQMNLKNKNIKKIRKGRLIMISQLELNNESVNPTKAYGIAPAIKSKVTYEDPELVISISISHK